MKIYLILFSFLFLVTFSCKKEKQAIDVSGISFNIKLHRFDQEYHQSNAQNIKDLKVKYPFLFPGDAPDSLWINKKNDSLTQVLYREAQAVFGDFSNEKKEIETLFKHVKYYYPRINEPQLITLISDLDLDNQVIYADSLLLVSLDTYLGKDKIYYSNYPSYLKSNFSKSHITIDIAEEISKQIVPHIPYRIFIERMIAAGKTKYAIQQFLPNKSVADIMGYTSEKMNWANREEEEIWKYFIDKEYLYSTDKDLQRRFIDVAPFSKFYFATDNESPGQIGIWMGYRIIRSYMKNNQVSLPEMLATPPIDIFNKSKYKPKL